METKEKQRIMVGTGYRSVSESRGQPVEKISGCWVPRCWARSIFCSLNVSGDIIGCSSELSQWTTQQQAQSLSIRELV